MANNSPLGREEKLEIVEALRKGNASHRELARRFKRSQSTISKLARDSGITPVHRRMRSPAAADLEGSFTREERINLTDRVLGVIGALVEGGGLNPRELRETTQALKQTLDARRAEDIAPPEQSEESKQNTWVPLGLGDIRYDISTPFGQELAKKMQEEYFAAEHDGRRDDHDRGVEE
jgi:transposase-like protein